MNEQAKVEQLKSMMGYMMPMDALIDAQLMLWRTLPEEDAAKSFGRLLSTLNHEQALTMLAVMFTRLCRATTEVRKEGN